jgi:hypothetical protein
MADESAPEPVQASLLGAAIGGLALLMVALPLFLTAAAWVTFHEEVRTRTLLPMIAVSLVPPSWSEFRRP